MSIQELKTDLENLDKSILIINFHQSFFSCRADARLIKKDSLDKMYTITKAKNIFGIVKILNKDLINKDSSIMFECFFDKDFTYKNNQLTIKNY